MDWHDLTCPCPGVSFKLDFSDIRADIEETDRGVEMPTREEIRRMRWGVGNGNTNQSIRFIPKIDSTRTRALKALLIDCAAVFTTLAKLQAASMIHGYLVDLYRIAMDENGRVRLLDLSCLRYYAPHQWKQLDEDAKEDHWDSIRAIFN
ncbi:hypothetical protein B0H14DRAFT_2594958 [Mycena olivaceomarginata]|nr:hypothetical protein B0H14DRAFT_2594958 [Mycena olivaceomarginata]